MPRRAFAYFILLLLKFDVLPRAGDGKALVFVVDAGGGLFDEEVLSRVGYELDLGRSVHLIGYLDDGDV